VSNGYVGIFSVELYFPEAGSLKDKRQHLRSAKAQLKNRFGASVAETAHHDVWQRSRLVIALTAAEASALERLMNSAERYLHGQEYELAVLERRIIAPGDE
jgi:uncharacterized protein YlxP (DUF503 family)